MAANSPQSVKENEVCLSPESGCHLAISSLHQDILLNEVRSESFVPTAKFERLVFSLFIKLVTQFLERDSSKELAKAVEKQLVIINEISLKDEKYVYVIMKDCPVDFLDNLISTCGNSNISLEFLNQLAMLLLRITTVSFGEDRTHPWSLTFHHRLIEGILKLRSLTRPDCLQLLRKLCDTPAVKDSVRQKETFEKILDFVTHVLSDDGVSEELLMETVGFLIYISEEQTNLLRTCAARKIDDLLLRRDLESGTVQKFLHSVSISTSKVMLSSPRTSTPQKTYTLSITDLHPSPNFSGQQRLEQKRSFSLSKGSYMPIMTSSRHIFLDVKNIEHLTGPMISRAVCGLLNSGNGGVIYSGVRSDGLVHGLQTSRAQRDSFRCEMDRLLRTELDPPLCPSLLTVHFVAVLDPRPAKGEAAEFSVLEIRIPSDLGQIYTWKKENKVFTCRLSNRIEELSLKGIRELAVDLGRREYAPVVKQLEEQLRNLSCSTEVPE